VGKVETGMGETAEGSERKIFMTFWYVDYFPVSPSPHPGAVFRPFLRGGRSCISLILDDDQGMNYKNEDSPINSQQVWNERRVNGELCAS
jgi:hypothetical protein